VTNQRRVSRHLRHVWILIAFGATVIGCGPPIRVYSYWGPGTRFSETTRTYDWAPDAQQTSGEGRPKNPRIDELIRQAVEKHLALKGYEKALQTKPDFWIDYRVAREVRGNMYGGPGFTEFAEGSLALYVVNPANSKLIWRGIVRAALDDAAPPDKRVEILDRAVKKVLDQVPSRPTKK